MVMDTHKRLTQLFDSESITAGTLATSNTVNLYDCIYAGIFISISAGATGGLDISLQVSPDQGATWFTLQDAMDADDPTLPAYLAFGGISLPGSLVRLQIRGDGGIIGTYIISAWIMGYR